MRVALYTLGCKVNQYETQVIREEFIKLGHTPVSEKGEFDCVVINSCTVTAESDRKTRQTLRKFRRNNPNAVIVLTGCMVQAFSKESEDLTEADIIVGNTDIKRIPLLTEQFLKDGKRIIDIETHGRKEKFNTPNIEAFAERTRAYMKIQDGCERFCSYCIIPYARGFVRSKSLKSIKEESQKLAKNGYIEVVLVGINLTSYGKGEDIDLADAVEVVCSVDGIKRVRLGSLEPDHLSNDMLNRLKCQEKFCPQFHLSLQSGCDKTLKRMNRHYDSAFYYDLVKKIRSVFPNSAITTDIMVGFAGETAEEFQESVEFLKKVGFAKTHVFAYSRRKGTVAYSMPEQISNSEKMRRSKIMIGAAAECEKNFLKSQIGLEPYVLFEAKKNNEYTGYTENYSKVAVMSNENLEGKIKKVKIIGVDKEFCIGQV